MSEIDWTWIVQVAPPWWVPIFHRVMAFGTSLDVTQDEQAVSDAVQTFALTLPADLTRIQQDDFCSVFYESLNDRHDRRYRLMIHFRNSLLRTTDPLSDHASNSLVRDFARDTIANLTDLDRMQTEIENFCATLLTPQDPRALRALLVVEFKWSIDNFRPDFPQIMGLFQAYVQLHPSAVHPHPRDRFSHFTHFLTPQMWQRLYQARPHLLAPFEPVVPPVEDGWGVVMPLWFRPVLPTDPTWGEALNVSNVDTEGSRTLLEACHYAHDMLNLQLALNVVSERMVDIVFEFLVERPHDVPGHDALATLQRSRDDLRGMYFVEKYENGDDFSIENCPLIRDRLEREEALLDQVRARHVDAERFLVAMEASFLGARDRFFAAALRYERSKYRQFIKSAVNSLKTERLRQIDYTQNVLRSWEYAWEPPVMPPFHQDHTICPICQEDLGGEDGEIVADPVVTGCCQRPFHIDCILSWLLEKINNDAGMTCPMCRDRKGSDFLADVLEMKVMQMDNL
ncbi:hypothetical protein AYL99_07912 [Fonsecaea erecta]|uniref:RING-type domain-containing protein n=1 Tax=Fonsecaea erecta TaxID=1367422 RepID=A0A178ZBL4_9EURO|nr:hypothetical protein AYL99_07912 [Fonsecaea erecta]OAP57174.1 hypothetical protein AYL99_07912 [Fonsecaea erecta]